MKDGTNIRSKPEHRFSVANLTLIVKHAARMIILAPLLVMGMSVGTSPVAPTETSPVAPTETPPVAPTETPAASVPTLPLGKGTASAEWGKGAYIENNGH